MPPNIYLPIAARVSEVRRESLDIKTLVLEAVDAPVPAWLPGQFAMYGVFGEGECPLTIASSPTRGRFECTLRRAGRVTRALFDVDEGDVIGLRGPYGNAFPLDRWKGRGLVFVAGGIGLPALRSSIEYVLDNRGDYGPITIVYGAKATHELIYRREIESWAAARDTRVVLTVDPGGQTPEWKGEVGLVPAVLEKVAPSAVNAVALVCGPPVMIKFTLPALARLGFAPEAVYTTLENRMKCGVGKCGRCNVGPIYVCKCGPVFSAAEIAKMPDDF
jgi:NAD(P)H-flavin reductase